MTRVYVLVIVLAAFGASLEATTDEGTGYLLGMCGGVALGLAAERAARQIERGDGE